MSQAIHRRRVLRVGLALGTALVIPAARACEFFTTTLRVTHPWTRASVGDATSAMVCMTFDQVLRDDRLIGVATPVAATVEMGGAMAGPRVDFPIPQDRESELSETGTYLRLVGLRFPLEVAREYPLQLVFEKGGVVDATLSVDYEAGA